MDNREFAMAMLEYEEVYKKLKELEDKIIPHVLEMESTQSIGNVTAKFSKGRTSYNYEAVRDTMPPLKLNEYISRHTTTVTKVDWRSLCKEVNFDPPMDKEPVPYVKIDVSI